jgi:uncharacterized repeat protein (TIGR02543 family)
MLKRISKFALLVFFISMLTPIVAPGVLEESYARSGKVTICHKTNSVKNPYRRITVANSALNSGHKNHTGALWTTSSVQGDTWGDIIPDATSGGASNYTLNFTATGQAIWKGLTLNPVTGSAVCKAMTMKQFRDSELAAGQSEAEVIASIVADKADEDLALLQILGLTFATFDSPAELDSAVTASQAVVVTTQAASSVTTTTATLNGTVKTDATALTCHFEYDDNAGLGSSTLNPSTATSVPLNTTTSRSVNLTGLTTNTKYYFRLVCHDSGGGDIYGDTFFFTTGTTYSITYDSNTAISGLVPIDSSLYSASESANIRGNENSLVKTGYSFSGWTELANGSGTVYSPSNTATIAMSQNRTLYAKWTATTFPVVFDSNTATSGSMSNQTYTAGTALALTSNGFSKTGYAFAGWATTSGGTVTYSDAQSLTLYETSTVYAKWTAQNYSVTFDSNTATSGTMSNQSFTAGTGQALTTNGFTKTGFTFNGWATTSGGAVVYSNTASITIYSDITLYANWASNSDWRIDYDGNSNTGGTIPDFQSVTRTLPIATRTNSGALARTGYLFDGWNSNSGGTGTPYATGETITPIANTVLYAKWVATSFPISFDSNTATSGTMSNQTYTAGTGQALTGIGFNKTGFSFAGWATSAGGSVVYTDSQTVTLYETATVYAKWTSGTFSLTFDSNTATSGDMSNQSFTAGTAQAITSNGFSKSSFTFAGWSSTSGGSVEYTNGASLTIYAATTLYAIWTANSGGGSPGGGNSSSQAVTTKVTPAAVKKSAKLVTVATTPVKSAVVTVPLATTGGTTTAPGNSGSTPATGGTTERVNVSNTQLSQTTAINATAGKSVVFTGAGISQVNVVNNEVSVQAKQGFSGNATVKITVTNNGEVSIITAEVMVIPLPVTNPVVKVISDEKSRIQWVRSPNAVTYEVTQGGKLLCTTARSICTVQQKIAASPAVQIKALGRDQTESVGSAATYVPAAIITPVIPEIALVVNFDTAKYNLDAADRALIRAFAAEVAKYGYKEIDISGHTDSRGGINNNILSNNRAKESRDFLKSLLPNLKVTINGYADAINVATNATAPGMAANRRAEFRVVG